MPENTEISPPPGGWRLMELFNWIRGRLTPTPTRRELQRQHQLAIDALRWEAVQAARERGVKYEDSFGAAAEALAGSEAAAGDDGEAIRKSYQRHRRRLG